MTSRAMVPSDPTAAALAVVESKAPPKYLSAGQVRHLILMVENERDRLMLRVLWETGARISEVLALEGSDVDIEHRQIRFRTLKRRRDRRRRPVEEYRWIPVRPELAADLGNMMLRRQQAAGRLFPIGRTRAFQVVRDAAQKGGITCQGGGAVGPHTLRHSFAVHCLNSAVPINIVQRLMGHSSILNTMVYLRVVPADFRVYLSRMEF